MTRSKMRADRSPAWGRHIEDHCMSCMHINGPNVNCDEIKCDFAPAQGKVYRKQGRGIPKYKKGVNNTKMAHHDLMYAIAPPKACHSCRDRKAATEWNY